MISKEEAFERFKEIIGDKPVWQYLLKSQFLEHLSNFQSWALRQALFETERAVQEFFLSTALNNSSILAHAEDREYTPRKPVASTGKVLIKNEGLYNVSIAAGQPFLSPGNVYYRLDDAALVTPGSSVEVDITQVREYEIEETVTIEKIFYEVLLDSSLTDTVSQIKVYVKPEEDGSEYEEWEYARLLQNTTAESKVYDEFFSHTGQIGIRFGNGQYGIVPSLGSTIKVWMLLTQGDTFLLEGQWLKSSGTIFDFEGNVANLTVTVSEAIAGGAAKESIEEARANLHYWPIYNHQLVWDEDYVFFINRNIPNILWLKVWGEELAEAYYGPRYQHINKIFISGYAEDYPDLGDDILYVLRNEKLLNRKFEWVDPVFSYFTLRVEGKVPPSMVLSDVIQGIRDTLTNSYGKDSPNRLQQVKLHEIYEIINETGYFEDKKAYFVVTILDGTTEATRLHEMVSIQIESCEIDITSIEI